MKAKQLGSVIFEYPQEVQQECIIMGEKRKSAAGTYISYEAEMHTPEITLVSAVDDWLSVQDIQGIQAMCETMGTGYTLTYEDDSIVQVYFDHSRDVSFTEIQEGVCFYYGTIPLIKIA